MPDISMCGDQECFQRKSCYRSPASGTRPNEFRQTWFATSPRRIERKPGELACDYLWATVKHDEE